MALLLYTTSAVLSPTSAVDVSALRRALSEHGSVLSHLGGSPAAAAGAGGGGAAAAGKGGGAVASPLMRAVFATQLQARAAFGSDGMHEAVRALGLRAELEADAGDGNAGGGGGFVCVRPPATAAPATARSSPVSPRSPPGA